MPATLPTRTLGNGLVVSSIGLGCMGLSFGIGDPTKLNRDESLALIHAAYEQGVTLFDTAECYGPHTNEQLVGDALQQYTIPREKVVIATKMGIYRDAENNILLDSKPARIREALEGSLRRLQTTYVDLYYIHRIDVGTPIEDVAETMKQLKAEGKIRHWGVSEANANTIRKAHAVFPLTAVQNEYSIMCRDVEADLLPTLEELGIGLVAFSPLGRALLTATFDPTTVCENDLRKTLPRFQGENYDHNLSIVELVKEWATKKGVNPAQFALTWLYAQRPYIVPIPGTTKVTRLAENLVSTKAEVQLSAEELKTFNEALDKIVVRGDRYTAANLKLINN